MSWKAGRIFKKGRVRGRYYYWNGKRTTKTFRSVKDGKPTHRPRTTRRSR